jgi:hypothetical protein
LTGPPLKRGQFAVLVKIDCIDGTTNGWNPAACGGG